MQKRINYLIELYQKLKPNEHIDRFTLINNAKIEAIAAIDGPAYHRVKNWLEAKLGESIQKETKGELKIKEDVSKFHSILSQCFDLAKDRMPKYGNSWRVMDIRSLSRLMIMKLDRIAELGEENAKTKDELMDVLNYCAFGLIKFDELSSELSNELNNS